jgi:aspartyl/asparaginyl-tRNA synthetase
VKQVLLMLAVLLLTAGVALAADGAAEVKVNDLIEQATAFDGKTITIAGEVVGDVMIRGEYGWIDVNDGTNDIGVWAPAETLRAIRHVGRYHTLGDRVEVTGVFHRADPAQGGDLDLHATSLRILQPGTPVQHPLDPGGYVLAGGALLAAAAMGACLWVRKRMNVKAH